jgi:hypothetical protein
MNVSPMIPCSLAARLLSERLDGPLPSGQRLRLAGHLLLCDGCRAADRQFTFLRASVKAMEQAPEPPPGPPR